MEATLVVLDDLEVGDASGWIIAFHQRSSIRLLFFAACVSARTTLRREREGDKVYDPLTSRHPETLHEMLHPTAEDVADLSGAALIDMVGEEAVDGPDVALRSEPRTGAATRSCACAVEPALAQKA